MRNQLFELFLLPGPRKGANVPLQSLKIISIQVEKTGEKSILKT
jgi:hypothetical protein